MVSRFNFSFVDAVFKLIGLALQCKTQSLLQAQLKFAFHFIVVLGYAKMSRGKQSSSHLVLWIWQRQCLKI